MISLEDWLRIYAAVQAEFGNTALGEVVCAVAEIYGVEKALLNLNRVLAQLWMPAERPVT